MPDLLFNDVCELLMRPGTWDITSMSSCDLKYQDLPSFFDKGLWRTRNRYQLSCHDDKWWSGIESPECFRDDKQRRKAAVTVMRLMRLNCHGIQKHLQMLFIVSVLSVFLAGSILRSYYSSCWLDIDREADQNAFKKIFLRGCSKIYLFLDCIVLIFTSLQTKFISFLPFHTCVNLSISN